MQFESIQFDIDTISIKILQKIIRTLSKIFALRSVEYFPKLRTSIQFDLVRFTSNIFDFINI
jgi:hypothetical protein